MRVYYVVRDQSIEKQTDSQRRVLMTQWRSQPFADTIARRRTGPNEQLTLGKRSLSGEYLLGGIDLTDADVIQSLDMEAGKIDGRVKQIQRQIEMVVLAELCAALPAEDAARADQLSVQAIAWGERDAAITEVQAYLRTNAAIWYAG